MSHLGQNILLFENDLFHFSGRQLVFPDAGYLPVIQIYADITVLINIAYTEPHGERVFHLGRMQVLGNRIAHAVFSNQPYCFLSGGIADLSFDIQSRIFAGFSASWET